MKQFALATVGALLAGNLFALPPNPAEPTKQPKAEPATTLDLGDGVKLELVAIRAGSFTMGEVKDRDAKPAHNVTIPKPFYLGKYEVTQEQWKAVIGSAYAAKTTKGAKLPIDTVEWWEAQEFCAKLGAKFTGKTFRLPSEAEWEYACRAGTATKYCCGDDIATLVDYAWFQRNDDKNPNPKVKGIADTHPVGEK